MIDINFFAKKAAEAKQAAGGNGNHNPVNTSAGRANGENSAELQVTFRGVVYPWHLDHMNHMNVRHYTAAFDEANWILLAVLGLDSCYFERHRRGMAALEQTIRYQKELRSGEAFEIRSSVLEVRDKTIRLQHDMYKVRCGDLAASTTILGVHIDAEARRGIPFPADVKDRADFLNASTLAVDAGRETCVRP